MGIIEFYCLLILRRLVSIAYSLTRFKMRVLYFVLVFFLVISIPGTIESWKMMVKNEGVTALGVRHRLRNVDALYLGGNVWIGKSKLMLIYLSPDDNSVLVYRRRVVGEDWFLSDYVEDGGIDE